MEDETALLIWAARASERPSNQTWAAENRSGYSLCSTVEVSFLLRPARENLVLLRVELRSEPAISAEGGLDGGTASLGRYYEQARVSKSVWRWASASWTNGQLGSLRMRRACSREIWYHSPRPVGLERGRKTTTLSVTRSTFMISRHGSVARRWRYRSATPAADRPTVRTSWGHGRPRRSDLCSDGLRPSGLGRIQPQFAESLTEF